MLGHWFERSEFGQLLAPDKNVPGADAATDDDSEAKEEESSFWQIVAPDPNKASSSSSPNKQAGSIKTKEEPSSKYYNRENSIPYLKTNNSNKKIVKEARILSLSDIDDVDNDLLHKEPEKGVLPEGSKLIAIGSSLQDFVSEEEIKKQEPNVLFVSHPLSKEPLVEILNEFPTIEWIHSRSAGIDYIHSDELIKACSSSNNKNIKLTNAKGVFSSTLAEYTIMACSYFAKDLPRLLKQKQNKEWIKYPILELRGATIGIVGYGDIGRATAKLAKAYGMRVVALKRTPTKDDEYCDVMYGLDKLNTLMEESDYVLISTPLTPETQGMISKEVLDHAKDTTVIINVGRGPIIDETALIDCLQNQKIKGAALDVFTEEPLSPNNQLWELDNVLLSPHNMDMTRTFMKESVDFFINDNLQRFVRNDVLLNIVNINDGY